MIKNFIKIAMRIIKRYKAYSFINVFGLSISLACVMLIFLFVKDELSYDKFYPEGKNIYRVATRGKVGDRIFDVNACCAPLAATAVDEFPEVKKAVRLYFKENVLLKYKEKQFREDRLLYADSNFFDVFSRPFIYGNPKQALKGTKKIVLTQTAANKYFGNENPVGRIIRVGAKSMYTVTGVVEDVPHNSHFHYDIIVPLLLPPSENDNWISNYLLTYFLLESEADYKTLEDKFPDFTLRYYGSSLKEHAGIDLNAWKSDGNDFSYYLEPLESIYLHSTVENPVEPVGDIEYVYIFSAIAFFILLLACVNFMNLTTALSFSRSKEVGVRKLFGSSRKGLILQFLSETLLLSLLAGVVSLFMVELLMPYFNSLTRKSIESGELWNPVSIVFLMGIILIVVLLAGSYSAFSLSGFKIQNVLKGVVKTGPLGKRIRASLVIFQFAVAIAILISAFVIKSQVNYMQYKKLGFDKERVLVVDRSEVLEVEQQQTIKGELKKFTGVEGVSFSWHIPGRQTNGWGFYSEGASPEEILNFRVMEVDDEFQDVIGLKLKGGRFFEPNRLSDTAVIVANESAINALGYKNAIGSTVYRGGEGGRTPNEIVGVVENFHFGSMKEKIYPLVFFYTPDSPKRFMLVRLSGGRTKEGLEYIEKMWSRITGGYPFEYFFLDNDFNNLFKGEERVSNILGSFTLLAFLIALLGLLGLVSFEMQHRTKEIGVRKVLGSSDGQLFFLLSRNLCYSVILGNVIAWPISWYFMNKWLLNFIYRIEFPWYYFLIALGISLLLALLTVSSHTVRASRSNPVESLRYE